MRGLGLPFLLLVAASGLPVVVWGCSTFGATDPVAAPVQDAATPTATPTATATSAPGTQPRCDPEGAFGQPTLAEGLSTAGDETGMWLSPDEKRAYVSASALAGGKDTDIRLASRTDREAAFGRPAAIAGLGAVNTQDGQPAVSLSSDELQVYFQHDPAAPALPGLRVATRKSITAPFSTPLAVTFGLGGVDSAGLQPYLTRNGQFLYFSRKGSAGEYRINAAKSVEGRLDVFEKEGELSTLGADGSSDYSPVVAQNDRAIFFGSRRAGGNGASDVWIAERLTTVADFGSPVNLGALVNSEAEDYPVAVTDDGCVLYFVSTRPGGPGGADIWKTARAKPR